MTHVLDEPIEATEDAIHESFLHRNVYDWWGPGTPKKQKQKARDSLRSMIATLRILRAERDGKRRAAEVRRQRLEEARAEGRREERERVDVILSRRASEAERWIGAVAAAIEDARKEIRDEARREAEEYSSRLDAEVEETNRLRAENERLRETAQQLEEEQEKIIKESCK